MTPEEICLLLGFIIGFCVGFIVCGFWATYERMQEAKRDWQESIKKEEK